MQNSFNININCVIFGVNNALNKRCVLSSNKEDISIPKFLLDYSQVNNIESSIISFVKEHVFVSDLELLPQIITLHTSNIQTDNDNTINAVYGFIVDYNSSINDEKAYWIEFDPLKEHKLSHVLFEVMHKLT